MATKNLYYRAVLRRKNIIGEFIYGFAMILASYPRLMLEVFVRRKFGQRYFTLATALTIFALLMLYPSYLSKLFSFGSRYSMRHNDGGSWAYATWYLFAAVFLVFSFLHWREQKMTKSVFDFGRFSLSAGLTHPFFFQINIMGWKPTVRQIEIFIEPALFLIIGFFLHLIGQKLGGLLILNSIIYSLSYAGAYKSGDNFVMDRIDEMLAHEGMADSFIDDNPNNNKGVRFRCDKPGKEELRRKLSENFIEEGEDVSFAV